MPVQSETIQISEEVERLEGEREELAAKVAGLEPGNPKRDDLAQEGVQIDAWLDGLDAVHDPPTGVDFPAIEEVTLGGLTGGEYGQVEDTLVSSAQSRGDASVGSGAMRVHTVAKGTQDAPYLDDADSYEARVAATARLPLGYLKWAESRIDDLTSVGGNERTRFADLVAEKRDPETSTTDSS